MKKYFLIAATIFLTSSCAELFQIANSLNLQGPLTDQEVNLGLKEALSVGTQNATKILAVADGYYGDALVKIPLPKEADIIKNNINRIPGGEALIENVIKGINRAAEDAASEAAPIFLDAVKQMTFADAMNILGGDKHAATNYFHSKTKQQLISLYSSKISASLDKKLVSDVSAQSSWDLLTGQWNSFAKTTVGAIAGMNVVETNLSQYLTEKAIDGLFLKIANEEEQIRNNPQARVSYILQRVFGQQQQ